MPLEPGTTLGPYAVTAKIGKGGMGEVYRARDTKLKRQVALKILPEAFSADPERLAESDTSVRSLCRSSAVFRVTLLGNALLRADDTGQIL